MIKIFALSFKYSQNASLNILFPTLLSILANGSSIKYKSASLYKHLAREILAFWPPLTFELVLFISVSFPYDNNSKS